MVFYLVHLYNKELETQVFTTCKTKTDLAKLINNLNDNIDVVETNLLSGEFVSTHQELCKNPNGLELGKEQYMLTNKAIFEETELVNKVISTCKDPVAASQLKMAVLTLKVLSSIRTNQVLIMEKMGVTKLQPKPRTVEILGTTKVETKSTTK